LVIPFFFQANATVASRPFPPSLPSASPTIRTSPSFGRKESKISSRQVGGSWQSDDKNATVGEEGILIEILSVDRIHE
jgi:hypothetical protein